MNNIRFKVVLGMILTAAVVRLLPHPPNFTPIGAMALFGAARFRDWRVGFLAPLAALTLSQFAIRSFYLFPVIVLAFVMMSCIGLFLRHRRGVLPVSAAVISGSAIFFLVTNFAAWAGGGYPRTPGGLMVCYAAGIPFFWNTLGGDALYVVILFGGLAFAERRFPVLRETGAVTAA